MPTLWHTLQTQGVPPAVGKFLKKTAGAGRLGCGERRVEPAARRVKNFFYLNIAQVELVRNFLYIIYYI